MIHIKTRACMIEYGSHLEMMIRKIKDSRSPYIVLGKGGCWQKQNDRIRLLEVSTNEQCQPFISNILIFEGFS